MHRRQIIVRLQKLRFPSLQRKVKEVEREHHQLYLLIQSRVMRRLAKRKFRRSRVPDHTNIVLIFSERNVRPRAFLYKAYNCRRARD